MTGEELNRTDVEYKNYWDTPNKKYIPVNRRLFYEYFNIFSKFTVEEWSSASGEDKTALKIAYKKMMESRKC